MTLSIIIVSFNARADLERCLRSLADAPPRLDHEIIVVDNGSSDGSVEVARAYRSVRTIALSRNGGFAAGNNAGIRESRGRLLLLLNSDTVVPAGAVDRLRRPAATASRTLAWLDRVWSTRKGASSCRSAR